MGSSAFSPWDTSSLTLNTGCLMCVTLLNNIIFVNVITEKHIYNSKSILKSRFVSYFLKNKILRRTVNIPEILQRGVHLPGSKSLTIRARWQPASSRSIRITWSMVNLLTRTVTHLSITSTERHASLESRGDATNCTNAKRPFAVVIIPCDAPELWVLLGFPATRWIGPQRPFLQLSGQDLTKGI